MSLRKGGLARELDGSFYHCEGLKVEITEIQ